MIDLKVILTRLFWFKESYQKNHQLPQKMGVYGKDRFYILSWEFLHCYFVISFWMRGVISSCLNSERRSNN